MRWVLTCFLLSTLLVALTGANQRRHHQRERKVNKKHWDHHTIPLTTSADYHHEASFIPKDPGVSYKHKERDVSYNHKGSDERFYSEPKPEENSYSRKKNKKAPEKGSQPVVDPKEGSLVQSLTPPEEEEDYHKPRPPSNMCPSTQACREDLETNMAIRLMQIQDQILKQTGLTRPPDMSQVVISENPRLQKIIKDINKDAEAPMGKHKPYAKPSDMAYADEAPDGSDMVFISASKAPEYVKVPGREVIFFNLRNQHISRVAAARLHLWLRSDKFIKHETVATIMVYLVKPSNGSGLAKLSVIDNDIDVEYTSKGNWVTIDAYSLVRNWVHRPEANLGFVLDIQAFKSGKQVQFHTVHSDKIRAPSLELDVSDSSSGRHRRFANNRICTNKKVEKVCCRYPLEVNFVEFQWDFIVAPKRYEANLCRGDCPFVFAQKYPHSKLLEQKFNNTNSNHGPCCGARDLDPLRMVYFDGKRIKVSVIKDMVVRKCSCT